MTAVQHSAIYEGLVQHRRHLPVPHRFVHRIAMLWIDLDEHESVFAGRWLWSTGRLAPWQVRRRDLLGPPERPLRDAVLDVVERHLGCRPTGPIRMLTLPRTFGFAFNPVTFYYVYQRAADGDERVAAVVAEITNTPWRERHCYVVGATAGDRADESLGATFAKAFHVSPFLPPGLRYDWSFAPPGTTLNVAMADRDGDDVVFDASLSLRRVAWSPAALRRYAWRQGPIALWVIAAIWLHAARLWWKGVPFHPHPRRTPTAGAVTSGVRT